MAGRTDYGFAALCADPVYKLARALDVVDDLSAQMLAENVFRKKPHEAVRVNDCAGIRHNAEPVGVAVKSKAVIGADFLHLVDQSLKILRFGRGRMVVREMSVDIAVKRNDFNVVFDAAGFFCDAPTLPFDPFTNALNLIGKERDARCHHLQAVVLRWIVRARHGNARAAIEVLRCVIENGSRYGADGQNIHAGRGNALHKGVLKLFTRESAVPVEAETLDARVMRHGAELATDSSNGVLPQRPVYNAADVVGLEDGSVDFHAFLICFLPPRSVFGNAEAALAGEMDRRVDKALLGAAVIAPPFEAVGRTMHVAKRGGNSVRELNFAACTGLLVCEVLED